MYELERKARVDHRAIRARLEDRGLTPDAVFVQVDTYLNHPMRDFGETDEALRIRREHPPEQPGAAEINVTYKGPRVDSSAKTRRELETAVGSEDELLAILECLDFVVVAEVKKQRTRYELDGTVICLDTVHQLGEFVEIETHASDDTLTEAEDRVDTMTAELGIDDEQTFTTPYLSMLLDGK